jgi:hypothetical protein
MSPATSDEIRSLPARAVTMVLCAPDTAGPWSAIIWITSSMNSQAYLGMAFGLTGKIMLLRTVLAGKEILIGYPSGMVDVKVEMRMDSEAFYASIRVSSRTLSSSSSLSTVSMRTFTRSASMTGPARLLNFSAISEKPMGNSADPRAKSTRASNR